jgi:leader peptidase (prepilin peptidase) / N-methyltransferase
MWQAPVIVGALIALAAGLGASVGSFANVVFDRVPDGRSIVRPPSSCPGCQQQLRPWENIPIVAWLALRGRCHRCHCAIGVRSLLIEVAGGICGALAMAAATS